MKIGFLQSIIRKEEKLLYEELKNKKVEFDKIDVRDLVLDYHEKMEHYDVILERCINHSRALYTLKLLNDWGIKTVNKYDVANVCGNKLLTTAALSEHNVPIPRTKVAYTPESALKAIEEIGYPVVLKPAVGSWGRLISKINDSDAAETVLEHKTVLGSYHHSVFYIQEYILKKNRDIRSFVVGDKTIAAIYRHSQHWITNTARGGTTSNCPVTDELNDISVQGAKAVGGGVVALDIFETPEGFKVNEVNYTMEFRNSIKVTGVNIPEKIIDYVIEVAEGKHE